MGGGTEGRLVAGVAGRKTGRQRGRVSFQNNIRPDISW